MNFVRFKLIVTNIAVLLLISRILCMAVFYFFGDHLAAALLLLNVLADAAILLATYIVAAINLPNYVFLALKNRINKTPSGRSKKLLRALYFFMAKHRLHDRSRLKNFLWYCFEIEVIVVSLIFVALRGWGYGFEYFLVVIFTFFYMNFRYRAKRVYFIPCAIGIIYIGLYLYSDHHELYSLEQVVIYLINGTFALVMIFAVQIASEIGKVIKVINDNNRCEYIRSLSSLDALSGTLAKYSFLDVASARLEHSPEDNIISQASVIYIEFSNLQAINQQYGMHIGDVALKELAYMILQVCENYDHYITRWSGNAFLVFLINEDERIASMLAEQIDKEAALNRFSIKGIRIAIEYSIACESNFTYNLGELIDEAISGLKQQQKE